MGKLIAIATVVLTILGFVLESKSPIISGMCKALAGIAFIIYFLIHVFREEALESIPEKKSH
ncbi:MAG: hypothetical protein SFY81_05035 [Verrucomicrobiota bacterium]|nr:hypothetical protein [Verrucomicrobiota bacterium]